MSAERLLEAARLLRERAEAATPGPWRWEAPSSEKWPQGDQSLLGAGDATVLYGWGYDVSGIDATDADRTFISTASPLLGLAVAAWLEDLLARHADGGEEDLVLHPEDPCEVCEDLGGHKVRVCDGCYPSYDGMEARATWPCAELRAAFLIADAILGGAA